MNVNPSQQTSESVDGACTEFERDFGSFMEDCISFGSSSSVQNPNNDDYFKRRRSESDDRAESSAARRRQSRILDRWDVMQAQEMITTMERRNLESELVALASLHIVSTLSSSFLRESQPPSSRRQASVTEIPRTQPSRIVQIWRDFEKEQLLNRERWERLRQRNNDLLGSNAAESQMSENNENLRDSSENDHRSWSQDHQLGLENSDLGDNSLPSSEQSPDLGDVESERVSQVIHGTENGVNDQDNSHREDWIIREWMQSFVQELRSVLRQRQDQGSLNSQENMSDENVEAQRIHEGLTDDNVEGQERSSRRRLQRLHGRQALSDVLMRIERERQQELQGLSEHRAVSDFAHRNRIESLLRGRFLRNETRTEEARPPSMVASELHQLRERNTVSGLREVVYDRLETNTNDNTINISNAIENSQLLNESLATDSNRMGANQADADRNWEENTNQERIQHEVVTTHERQNPEQIISSQSNELDNGNGQENSAVDDLTIEVHSSMHADNTRQSNGHWPETQFGATRSRRVLPMRILSRFPPLDDDYVYNIELEELGNRRSVSNLLHSRFRESLDQFIQSFVQRRGLTHISWRLQAPRTTDTDHQEQQRLHLNENQSQPIPTPLVLPPVPQPVPPPVPPPLPQWTRPSDHQCQYEWRTIRRLRLDMDKLNKGMKNVEKVLETCINMHTELHRLVKQEVSAALNRSPGTDEAGTSEDGLKWSHVRAGTCCICCDNAIDALLYRCGHMCTCSKCANELVRTREKCPMCRAPIVEVVRAYTIE